MNQWREISGRLPYPSVNRFPPTSRIIQDLQNCINPVSQRARNPARSIHTAASSNESEAAYGTHPVGLRRASNDNQEGRWRHRRGAAPCFPAHVPLYVYLHRGRRRAARHLHIAGATHVRRHPRRAHRGHAGRRVRGRTPRCHDHRRPPLRRRLQPHPQHQAAHLRRSRRPPPWRREGHPRHKGALKVLFGVASYALKWATLIDLGVVWAVSARVMTDRRTREDATVVATLVAESLAPFAGCPGRASSSTSCDPVACRRASQPHHGQWQAGGRGGTEGMRHLYAQEVNLLAPKDHRCDLDAALQELGDS